MRFLTSLVSIAVIGYTVMGRNHSTRIIEAIGASQASLIRAAMVPKDPTALERILNNPNLNEADRTWITAMMSDVDLSTL